MIARMGLGALALLAGFIAGIVVLAPANKVVGLSGVAEQPGVQLSGIDGRLLSGVVAQVASGNTQLTDVHWTLNPWALIGGKVAADLRFKLQDQIPAHGTVKAGLGGAITLTDWRTRLGLQQLKPVLNIPFLPVDGRAALDLEEARIGANQRPEYLRGTLTLSDVKWTLIKPVSTLGTFVVDLSTDDDGVMRGELRDDNAKIGLSGSVQLNPDGSYVANLNLLPRQDTPPMIRNMLPTLGRPNADGSYPVKQQGRVPGW